MSNFEISFPSSSALTGTISAAIVDHEGVAPASIIQADDNWAVDFKWQLKGPLASCICGEWCLTVRLESIGEGPEYSLGPVHIPLNPCGDGKYAYKFTVPAGDVSSESCGPTYKAVATLTFVTPCKRPGPIAGFVDLGLVQFYEDGKAE